jgi:hypothetical protein
MSSVVFAPPAHGGRNGHILFVRENTLMAAPFDAASAQLAGDVFPVAEGVSFTTDAVYVPTTVSENRVLLYQTGAAAAGGAKPNWLVRSIRQISGFGGCGRRRLRPCAFPR